MVTVRLQALSSENKDPKTYQFDVTDIGSLKKAPSRRSGTRAFLNLSMKLDQSVIIESVELVKFNEI
jgi:hypothetical protein